MGKQSTLIAGLLIIAIGVVLIVAHKTIASTGIIIVAGAIFLLAGLINLVFFSSRGRLYDRSGRVVESRRSGTASVFSIISGIAAMVLGLSMLIFQEMFASLIPFIFGCIIAIGAFLQIYWLAIGVRPFVLPTWLYIVPALLVGGAVYVFLRSTPTDDAMIMLISGISLTLFGLASGIESLLVGAAARKIRQETPTQPQIAENE